MSRFLLPPPMPSGTIPSDPEPPGAGALDLPALPPRSGSSARAWIAQARTAYEQQDFATCARRLEAARADGYDEPEGDLDLACGHALAGELDRALAAVERIATDGRLALRALEADDLLVVRNDPRWPSIRVRLAAGAEHREARNHAELAALFAADQADRAVWPIDGSVVGPRDEARLARVEALGTSGALSSPDDHLRAAFLFQHGSRASDYAQARALALRALTLEPGFLPARRLAAMAHDRLQHALGRPQIFATQAREGGGGWTLEPFERGAVDEETRWQWGLPPLAQSLAEWEAFGRRCPPPR